MENNKLSILKDLRKQTILDRIEIFCLIHGYIYEAEVAEWSKAVDLGSIPKGRGFKPHLLHF